MPKKKGVCSNTRTAKQPMSKVIPMLQGRDYLLGGNGAIEGEAFDCFGMIVEYQKLRYGLDMLKLHDSLDFPFFNYVEAYCGAHSLFMSALKEYLDLGFIKITIPYMSPGDILWVEFEGDPSCGIYTGFQKILVTSKKTKCIMITTQHYKMKGAYRWLRLYQ